MKPREHIPPGWLGSLHQAMTALDKCGVTAIDATVQIIGHLPDIEVKLRIWRQIPDEERATAEGIVAGFNGRIERTCEECGQPGHRWKFDGARDQILCDSHAKEIGG